MRRTARPPRKQMVLVARIAIALIGILLYAYFANRGMLPANPTERQPATLATPAPNQPSQRVSNLPTIVLDQLPAEARQTIQRIDAGGPFPYEKDGSTFQNRERLLPRQPSGYYREYTVVTPGSDDRGARRIVAGNAGELYYTDDHYDSFREVVR